VSERGLPIADGAATCPFVAFEDDRDERATVPDHRHRCYADIRPSPRALAHQEAYCLSSAFPVCPTFQDWARRESARARADAQARDDAAAADRAAARGAAAAGSVAGAAGLAAAADSATGSAGLAGDASFAADAEDGPPEHGDDAAVVGADDGVHGDDGGRAADADEPRRNPPREWSAPPPWLASSEAARQAGRNTDPPDFLARRYAEPGQGLAGSAADRLAGGPLPPPSAGRGDARQPYPDGDDERSLEEIDRRPPPVPRRPRAYDQHLGGPSKGPDWERPRRYEAYPTIRTRVGMPAIPRIVALAAVVAIAALAFFFLPAILGLGSDDNATGGSPSPSIAASASVEPTATPAATPILYRIKKGETLSKIATAHGVTLEQLLAANPDIKNPNKISEGQEITIPTPEPEVPDEFGPSETPEESP
jgi:hypothetical protein